MVQDMYNPEYYVGAYRDAGGRWRTTKYTEDLGPGSRAGTHSPADLQNLGATRAVLRARARRERVRRPDGAGVGAAPSTPAKTSEERAAKKDKRARDEDVEMDAGDDAAGAAEDSVAAAAPARAPRRTRSTPPAPLRRSETTRREPGSTGRRRRRVRAPRRGRIVGGRAEPSPRDGDGPARFPAATPCIVKMYDDEDDVKLNDVLELVGVLGIAPALAQEMQDMSAEPFGVFATEPAAAAAANGAAPPNANADASVDFEFMDEARAHNPPTSRSCPGSTFSPRAGASPQSFAVAALDSGAVEDAERAESHDPHDPSLRVDGSGGWGLRPLDGAFRGPLLVPSLARRGVEVREKLLAFLAAPLGGDALAAEYVLFALLARVHTRSDGMPIGKFGVTLLGAPDGADASPRRGSRWRRRWRRRWRCWRRRRRTCRCPSPRSTRAPGRPARTTPRTACAAARCSSRAARRWCWTRRRCRQARLTIAACATRAHWRIWRRRRSWRWISRSTRCACRRT